MLQTEVESTWSGVWNILWDVLPVKSKLVAIPDESDDAILVIHSYLTNNNIKCKCFPCTSSSIQENHISTNLIIIFVIID